MDQQESRVQPVVNKDSKKVSRCLYKMYSFFHMFSPKMEMVMTTSHQGSVQKIQNSKDSNLDYNQLFLSKYVNSVS